MEKTTQKPNIPQKIGSALSTLACVTALLLFLLITVQIYTQGYANIAGFSVFRVVTGSMEPNIPVGSLLLSKETPISQIETEDVVCFVSKEPATAGKVITHRVVSIIQKTDGTIVLETKGDANLSADRRYVTAENLVGRVILFTKEGNLMAGVVEFLSSEVGFLLCVLFPILLVAGFILRGCVRNIRKEMDTVVKELERSEIPPQEEYEAMEARIRQELLEEIKQGEQNNEGIEESQTTK